MGIYSRIRRNIVEYAKGNALGCFWLFYRWQRKVKGRLLCDALTFCMNRSAHRHGGYVGSGAVIGKGISLPHGLHGIFISRYAKIGENCRIYQNVTIGEVDRKAPVIGDDCLLGAGAVLIGGIRIGSHVKIGAGAVVHTDIPDYATVVPEAMRVIDGRKELEEREKT